ncbi:chloride channel protein [Nocardia seriolae]|uniref:Chloride channel protein CLC-e n=1 Tax=Nocardia seriolae TaxID=37332 RepID=A0ABC8AUX7_9NOCA|nr:chloride channel protein [Nocardia seriolae]APA97796.1 Chloride channel protein CLC-e [Nocardia seriolae]MTJ64444.1 chloride channel protein [Nocardia seriolae]MTJ73457.1 chloride channel protein [Nocardia seriolae]MTJ87562.1 chloride channel protein [Nocardia seriolae]MTK31553.1 chloride channel protein [Nocardia seriolae]
MLVLDGAGQNRLRISLGSRRSFLGWLRESSSGILVLAVAVGAATGIAAVAFRYLITGATRLFTGYDDYSGLGRIASAQWPALGFWFLLAVPVVAGAIYGPVIYRFAPEARGHGVPEVMYAVSERGGRIAPKVVVLKAFASALCIGGGGSVGREGPIVQIGSATGSTLAQLIRLDTPRVRLLVACGAAGGIAATFNAPLAGPFFAMELILRNFAAESFGAVVLSSVTASVVGRAILGNTAFLTLPVFAVRNPVEYPLYLLLGLVVGAVGVCFSKVLYLIEDLCDRAWRGPEWARPAVGGLLLGGLLIALPQMYGVGYPVLENAVEGKYMLGMLALLLIGKMLATSLTIGIGGSGGVFAPTLFIGAMAGTAFGEIVHQILPAATESPGAYGLVGMAAALGGSTRAPITAVIILFELTGEYSIILPLMVAVAVATGVSRLLSSDTIYTRKLLRRGIDIDRPHHPFAAVTAADLAQPIPESLWESSDLASAAKMLEKTPGGMLPAIDDRGRYRGCVSARDVAESLDAPEPPAAVAALIRTLPPITADTGFHDVVTALAGHGGTGLPVLDADRTAVIGWVNYEALLAVLHPDH